MSGHLRGDARKNLAAAPDAGTDVEALADSIGSCFSNVSDLPQWMQVPALGRYMRPLVLIAARAVLASDWLAAHDAALIAAAEARGGSFLIGHKPVTRQDYLAFTSAIGFGDDVTEPAARPDEMLDAVEQAFSEASEHRECPVICEPCGERLAATTCEHCHGSGGNAGLIEATLAYSECEWCAGVGKVHEGCAEKSYADLVAEVAAAEARGAAEGAQAVFEAIDRIAGGWPHEYQKAAARARARFEEPS